MVLLPAALVTLLVALYAVDVPYWDTWDWLDALYPDPAAPASDAIAGALFNGHRIAIPLAIDRVLFTVSSIYILPRIWLKVPLSLATLWLLLRLLHRTSAGPASVLARLGLAAFAFTLAYWPMWMDARQYSMHIVVLALVAAVDIATGRGHPHVRAAATAALCVMASLSYGPGLFTWPFVFALLWVRSPRPSTLALGLWVAAAAATVGLHAVQMRQTTSFADTASPGGVAVVHVAAAVAGLPAAPSTPALAYRATRVMGVVGLGLFAALATIALRCPWRMQALPWIAIGGWATTYAVAAGLARGGLGLPALHDPRFAYGSAFLWVAIVALLHLAATASVLDGPRITRARPVMLAASCLVAAGCLMASASPFVAPGGIGALHARLSAGRACLAHLRTATDACLEQLYPSAERLRAIALRLEGRHAAFLPAPRDDEGEPQSDEHHPVQ